MYCYKCGRQIEDGVLFCGYCGARQPQDEPGDEPDNWTSGAEYYAGRTSESDGQNRMGGAGNYGGTGNYGAGNYGGAGHYGHTGRYTGPMKDDDFDEDEDEERGLGKFPVLLIVLFVVLFLVAAALVYLVAGKSGQKKSQGQENGEASAQLQSETLLVGEDGAEENNGQAGTGAGVSGAGQNGTAGAGASGQGGTAADGQTTAGADQNGAAAGITGAEQNGGAAGMGTDGSAAGAGGAAGTGNASSTGQSALGSPEGAAAAETESPEENGGSTYQVIAGDYSWAEAEEYCREQGGHLATITSAEEQRQVEEAVSASGASLQVLWLGAANAGAADGQFAWITGETMSYTNWAPGEPSGTDQGTVEENYLVMYRGDGVWKWNDVPGEIAMYYSGDMGFVMETG